MSLDTILKKVKPSEREIREMKNFSAKILKVSEDISKGIAKPMMCGSVAKDTWISNKNELDLFLLFNKDVSRKVFEKKGLELGKNLIKNLKGKYEIAYAEHPYVRGFVRKYQIDIVPCYDIEPTRIRSAVDRTPHHVRFIKKNLKNHDEVRLLKQFCIGNNVYGADVKTQGLSGYLCELLIINYGSFSKLVKDASKWRAKKVVRGHKNFKAPLILIDPVDPNRNVAAAVSEETFYKFIKACKYYVRTKSDKLFFPRKEKPCSINEIKKEIKRRGTRWYIIKFKKPKVIEDTLYPQLRRMLKSIEKILKEGGFRILRKDFYCNKHCYLVFEADIWQVPKISKNIGPNVYSKHVDDFLKHYKNQRVFIENEEWIVEKEREFTVMLKLLKNLISKSKKELLQKGIPSKVVTEFRKSKIFSGGNALKEISKVPEDFRIFMREWFEKDLNVV